MKNAWLFEGKITKTLIWSSITLFVLAGCSEKHVPPPFIESVSPEEAYIGDPVTITGRNLKDPMRVVFNNVDSEIALGTNTMITTVVPNGADLGGNSISVENEGGISNTVSFNIVEDTRIKDQEPPTITKLYPSSNYINRSVLIYGDNLSSAKVTIDDVPAKITTNNKKVVTITVPEGLAFETVKIKITTPLGESNTLDFFVTGTLPIVTPILNFSNVSIPPPAYVPVISNDWSCGLFAETNSTSDDVNHIYIGEFNNDFGSGSTIEGYYEFSYDVGKGYNSLNFVEIKNLETNEIWVGQFSSKFDFPCVLEMVLISTKTGEVFICNFDRSSFGDECDS